jgi:malate dehydrogenase (oxaloacetate-decarboxylating)(NADP+)
VARRPLEARAYQESLTVRLGTGRETLRGMMLRARQRKLRVVFSEGTSETILRACSVLTEEGIATPILLGPEAEIRQTIERLGLGLDGVQLIDPAGSPRLDGYVEEYFRMRRRRGVMRAAAEQRLRQCECYAALMLHLSDADMMIAGGSTHYAESLRTILEVIGPAAGVRRVSSHSLVLLPRRGALFLADCGVNVEPDAEILAEIALHTAATARAIGIEPRVSMLSFSNFGSVDHPYARKVRRATEIAKEKAPQLVIDGEMQLATALDGRLRHEHFPFSSLDQDANVLVFPDLQSGNLALHLLQCVGGAVAIGPLLMGTRLPAHLLQYGATVEEVVNLVAVGAVEASAVARRPD